MYTVIKKTTHWAKEYTNKSHTLQAFSTIFVGNVAVTFVLIDSPEELERKVSSGPELGA